MTYLKNEQGQTLVDNFENRIRHGQPGSVPLYWIALEFIACARQKDTTRVQIIHDLSQMLAQDWQKEHGLRTIPDALITMVRENLDVAARLADYHSATNKQKPMAHISTDSKSGAHIIFTQRDLLPARWRAAQDAMELPDTRVGPVREFYRNAINYHPKPTLA